MAVYSDEKIDLIHRIARKQPLKMDVPHFHNKHELYFLESGQTKYVVGSEIYLVNPGDMVFVPKGTFHKTSGEDGSSTERVLLVFDDGFVGDEYKTYIDELVENNFIRLPEEQVYKIKDLCRKIENENKHKLSDYTEMQKLYLRQLIILISRYRIKKINNWPRWIKYIGKNSLLYYLLNIPIMWLIPSYNIHFITYFAANFIATTFLAFVYNIFSNSLARLSKKHLA